LPATWHNGERRSSVVGFCWFDGDWVLVSVAPALSFSSQAVCSLSIYANPYSSKGGVEEKGAERKLEKAGALRERYGHVRQHTLSASKLFCRLMAFPQKGKNGERGRVDGDTMSR